MASYGIALLGLVVSGCIYLHVCSIRPRNHLIPVFLYNWTKCLLPLGLRKVHLRPCASQLTAFASQHFCSLGHLDQLHYWPICHFVYFCRGNSNLQLLECADRFYLFCSSGYDASGLALAVRPWTLPEGIRRAANHLLVALGHDPPRHILPSRSYIWSDTGDQRCLCKWNYWYVIIAAVEFN